MPDTLPIPDDLPEKDRQRVEHVNRNISIRAEYPELRDQYGFQKARRILAERYACSVATVKMVLDERR